MLLVSHDRALLDAVGTRTVAFEDGRLRSYEGGWAEYAARARGAPRGGGGRRRGREAGAPRRGRSLVMRAGRRTARPRTRSGAIAELELEVEQAEVALAALEDELADPVMWSSPSRTERSTARHIAARQAVAEAYARWEQASAEPSI